MIQAEGCSPTTGGHPEAAIALAQGYLFNRANRGIFERAADFARRAQGSSPIDYVLGGRYREDTRSELRELVSTYQAHAQRSIRRVLDAGCGPGVTTLALADLLPEAHVLGLDVEEPALALARHLGAEQPRCEFERAGLEDFAPEHDGFDLIQCRSVIEHVYAPRLALTNLLGLLRPGGLAFVETPNYRFPWEPHVRLPMLPKSPKTLLALQCRASGRDPRFIEHLNFDCDPLTLIRWALASHPQIEVVDLMARKIETILLEGTERPCVRSRARIVAQLRRLPWAAGLASSTLSRLAVAPSVMLIFVRP